VDGMRSSQISARINEHPNTVREHLVRIRNKIKEAIIEDDD
jgi:DNA-binding CsgD family transcriptional regulator